MLLRVFFARSYFQVNWPIKIKNANNENDNMHYILEQPLYRLYITTAVDYTTKHAKMKHSIAIFLLPWDLKSNKQTTYNENSEKVMKMINHEQLPWSPWKPIMTDFENGGQSSKPHGNSRGSSSTGYWPASIYIHSLKIPPIFSNHQLGSFLVCKTKFRNSKFIWQI